MGTASFQCIPPDAELVEMWSDTVFWFRLHLQKNSFCCRLSFSQEDDLVCVYLSSTHYFDETNTSEKLFLIPTLSLRFFFPVLLNLSFHQL